MFVLFNEAKASGIDMKDMKTSDKNLYSIGGKNPSPTQRTLRGKSIGKEEEFPVDMTDLLGEGFIDGNLVAIDDIINELVEVSGFDRREGNFGPYYTVHIDEDRIFNCGAGAVLDRLDKVEDKLPMKMVFIKKVLNTGNRMYSVVSQATFMRMEQSGEIKG